MNFGISPFQNFGPI